ncbi:MAG: adenylate kinase family protein [Candidatus Aenigmarchaeota archaeon]|nr:adenylate kinase family protein [Candidatus Aenigmarchaeota archaeon]MBU5689294.1 adenylate kinase family protein [Candidatus Aenigmarchaeota archaeon]
MKIAITGTPGVGKTTIAKLLAKEFNMKYINLNDLAKKLNAYIGYDKIMKSKIVDMKKLYKEVKKIRGDFILDGHFSHDFDVDLVIVLRCRPDILEKRLKKRYPGNRLKVKENVDAEILGVITSEVLQRKKRFFEIDVSNKKKKEIIQEIKQRMKNKKKENIIDWIEKGYEIKI